MSAGSCYDERTAIPSALVRSLQHSTGSPIRRLADEGEQWQSGLTDGRDGGVPMPESALTPIAGPLSQPGGGLNT